jgi:hypothetical protein
MFLGYRRESRGVRIGRCERLLSGALSAIEPEPIPGVNPELLKIPKKPCDFLHSSSA